MKYRLPLPLLAAIAALPPLAVDMYLPAIPGIADSLSTEISTIQNSLSVFLMGFGLGQLFFGPLSDRYGRRPLAFFGLLCFGIFSGAIAFSTSADMFLLFRLLQGFLGAAASVVIPAMVRDSFGQDTAKGLSKVMMIMLVAPLIAPLGGSFLLQFGSWEIIFQALGFYGFAMLLLAVWRLPETRPQSVSATPPKNFLSNYRIIFAKRSIYWDLVTFILVALSFFTYLTSVSFIYISYYGVSETLFGILFAVAASALIAANWLNSLLVSRVKPRLMLCWGLVVAVLFSICLVLVNLFEFSVYWTVCCFFVIVGSLGIISVNNDSLILIEFPDQASSASAVIGTMRFGTGALAGPLLALIYNGTPVPITVMILVLLVGACLAQLMAWKKNQGHPG